jgi:hypothetical protein
MNQDVDSLDIKITATDIAGSSASVNFGLKIQYNVAVNDQNKGRIGLYPNPAWKDARISFDASAGEISLRIFNMTGECVMEIYDIRISPYTMDISKLPQGIYLIEVTGNKVCHIKLVKR